MSLTWLLFFWFSGALLWAGIAGFAIWVIARHMVYGFGLVGKLNKRSLESEIRD